MTTANSLVMKLSGPGMTALHRAGLAGLWMTLDALGKDGAGLADGSWTLSDHEVALRFGRPGPFFDALIRESFRTTRDGLIWLPGLGDPEDHPQASAQLNECLLGTFLQHGRTRGSDPANNPTGSRAVTVDDVQYPIRYHKVRWYAHQKVKIRRTGQPQRLLGWVHPGGAVRHEAFNKETGLQEPLELFLPLLYSVVGVLYFVVRKRGAGVRHAVVIPDVANLREYAVFRRNYMEGGEKELTVSGSGEAALRVLSALKAMNMMDAVGSTACKVVTFGKVQWDQQQKKRTGTFDVPKESSDRLETYQKCTQCLPPRLVKPEGGTPFWDYPQTPELVAENLLRGDLWWRGFSEFVSDKEVRDHVLGTSRYKGEREGLSKLISDPGLEGPQRAFVVACQEAWRRRLGELGARAGREGADPGRLFQREFERVRVSFSRCKSEATMREAVTDFWARAGPLPSLQSDWREVLALLNRDWRLARDLALLALASYAPKRKEEEELEAL